MKVINMFAGPGAGKSTTAAGVFYAMKQKGLSVELITEYAKDMTWERRFNIMSDQLYMFAKQHRRQLRVEDQVDYIVTDSPLLFSLIYASPNYPNTFEPLVRSFWNRFDNKNFFIQRTKEYVPIGRSQTESEAREIDDKVWCYLNDNEIDFTGIQGDDTAVAAIMNKLFRESPV